MLSREYRKSLACRLRAEYKLRLSRALGLNVRCGAQPMFHEGIPILRGSGELVIGDHIRLRGGPVRSRISTGPNGKIVFGNGVGVNYGAEFYSAQSVTIGDYTSIGAYVTIYDTSFHSVEEGEEVKVAPVKIGANVWIGRGVTIFPGVTIGDHSVLASNALITSDVPSRVLAGGSPAKVIREIRASDGWRRV
jgi:acetyltransferase-like isoleucine patch superfamily enzyme